MLRIPTQSITQHTNELHRHLHRHIQADPTQASQAMGQLQGFGADRIQLDPREWQHGHQHGFLPGCGCMPPPRVEHSSAPAGQGLATGEAGWPKGTVTTAGGYHVVPEGNSAAWSIYAPDQKPGETPNTRVWGDPHVNEKDGTRWDFTKNSDFVLGDGTRINVETTSEHGQSVSAALNIVNGADRVRIDGINGNNPQTSGISNDGYEWRAQHIASNPGRDTFHLAGDKENVHWIRERNGVQDGVVTGAYYDREQNRYEQKVDPTLTARVDPSLRPPIGSRAWGNMIRSETNDAFAKMVQDPAQAAQFGALTHMDHQQGAFQADMRDFFNSQFGQISLLMDLMNSESQWQRQLFQGQMLANPAFNFGFRN